MSSQIRSVLITGSTSGIGEATAVAFARDGHTVYVNGRDPARTRAAANRITEAAEEGWGKVLPAAGDVATAEGVRSVCEAVPELDILVNNAGIYTETPAFEISDEEWLRHFEVNVLSGVRLTRHYAPAMVRQGWGRVIFISSECALFTPKEMIHYGMTKAAQLSVSRGFALWVAGSGVTVNTVLPGPTRTPGAEEFISKSYPDLSFEEAERRYFQSYRPTSLIQRFALPSEVANMIRYLGSDEASATTGSALRVDGGVVPTIA
ncbi:SDR family NAD(P)-dependent oxidoreductase [Streptomyces sp. NBC_01264]|uniref:SDR family NAD(P)-dependent oxidoreductase n=1 Tax=Streptomyces sp. NBC_01264 TaxID=2903804 RepID=UPI00225B03A3|nr:SDR family oxidoreductase [Streptomyces sp. NBC_01264]MCX4784387.1 SDR family oxidoreductase [Streptomyces sp. NBC_01264]